MKKIGSFLLAAVLLCLCGCSGGAQADMAYNPTLPAKDTATVTLPAAERCVLPANDLLHGRLAYELQITQALGDRYYGCDAVQGDGGLLYDYALIDRAGGERFELQYEEGTQDWSVGSGAQIVMQERYLYEWLCFAQSEANGFPLYDVRLVRTDGQTGKVEVADRVEQASPFIYLCKVDDEHFLSFGTTQAPSDSTEYAVLSTAVLYNVNGQKRQIIAERFENGENWANSRGTLLEFFAAKDGEIYAYGRKNIEGECRYFLYHYDLNGHLLNTTELKGFDKIIGEEQPIDFQMNGDYIALRTYESLRTAVCRIGENGAELVMKSADGQVPYAVSGQYIVFMESNVEPDTAQPQGTDFALYVLDTASGKTAAMVFTVPVFEPYFVELRSLDDGTIILNYCESTFDPENILQFSVNASDLPKIMEFS